MSKYELVDIDYTGWPKWLADAHRRGKGVRCEVLSVPFVARVVAYKPGKEYPFVTLGNAYRHAEPIPKKTRRIMPPERAIPLLIKKGYTFDADGNLVNGMRTIIHHEAFELFGTSDECALDSFPGFLIEEVDA